MPTPEQVEAVAREIFQHDHLRTDMRPWSALDDGECQPYIRQAQAAIAAYENARPAVSDEELAAYITQQIERRTSVTMSGLYLVTTPGVLAQAILRTVRERLEP